MLTLKLLFYMVIIFFVYLFIDFLSIDPNVILSVKNKKYQIKAFALFDLKTLLEFYL